MRIAWFTPFRKVSAIGRFSRAVTNRLANAAEVDLWLAEPESEELHETALRIIRYPQIQNYHQFLLEYDVIIYNLGDHFRYHGPIYDTAVLAPGVVVLHDYVMHNFFAGYYSHRNAWHEYKQVMRHWYGEDVRLSKDLESSGVRRVWETDEAVQFPLFEQAIVGCEAVVTHANFLRDRVAQVGSAPVEKIHLAFDVDKNTPVLSRSKLGVPRDRKLIITVGNVNENKRVQVMMQALARAPELRDKVSYLVVGSCESVFGQEVQLLCRELSLEGCVRFVGYAGEDVVRSYLSHADFCVNLRWPPMEGASASCVEQMLYGKATIVTDSGFYSELPDDCVLKVRPDHELEDLTRHVRELASNDVLRRTLGETARRFATENFDPASYARQLLLFCSAVIGRRPTFNLMNVIAAELKAIGVTPEMAVLDRVAREGTALLEGEYDAPKL